jgi:hypothetical protein
MRYSVGFVLLLLALVASPLSVSAQAGEEGVTSEPNLEEPATSSAPAPEEPALQLELDDAGVEVAPGYPPRTPDGYTLKEMEVRVKRARVGVGVSSTALALGAIIAPLAALSPPNEDSGASSSDSYLAAYVWAAVLGVGLAGTIASGILLRKRKGQLRELKEAHYGTPHRVQWDLAQSRLVF